MAGSSHLGLSLESVARLAPRSLVASALAFGAPNSPGRRLPAYFLTVVLRRSRVRQRYRCHNQRVRSKVRQPRSIARVTLLEGLDAPEHSAVVQVLPISEVM